MAPAQNSGRCCRQCGKDIRWGVARFVGARTFCGEPCTLIWLMGEAARTAWSRAALEMGRRTYNPGWRARFYWASWVTWTARRRLDRWCGPGKSTAQLPWFWLPSLRGATALVLALAACGISGGRAPEPGALVSVQDGLTHFPQAPARSPTRFSDRPQAVPPAAILLPSVSLRGTRAPAPVAPAERPANVRLHPTSQGASEDLKRGDLSTREIALTFDGGSEANVAGEILDSLRSANVRATMFLTGQFIRLHPGWVRRMVADGHEIANHLDTHPHLTTYAANHRQQTLPTVTREFLIGQLRRAAESYHALIGKAMAPFWRAPYGEHNREIRAWAAEAGYRHVSWTQGAGTVEDLDTRDWVADRSSRIYRSREEIAARILEFGNGSPEGLSGGIVLMHLATHRKNDRPHESLPEILRTLDDQGYRLVTVSRLLAGLKDRPTPSEPASVDTNASAR